MNQHARVPLPTRPLLALLLLFLLLASLYNASIPLGEGPDEPGHLRYALFLAAEQRFPVQRVASAASDVPGEGHQPPLAYLLLLPAVVWLPDSAASNLPMTANPAFAWNSGSEPMAFIRASRQYFPWQGTTLGWHLARGMAALLGAVTVWCVWGAARTLCGQDSSVPLLAAALVALNPQFLFTSALVTNDALLTTLSAGILWLCLLHIQAPDDAPGTRWRVAGLGLLLGLALLTKQSALLLAPLVAAACWWSQRGRWAGLVRSLLLVGGVALLVAGWWYLRNWRLYGDILGLAAFQSTYATQPFAWQEPAAWGAALWQLYASFWGWFGWLTLPAPAWAYACYTGLVALALVGGVQQRSAPLAPGVLLLWLLLLLALAWVLSFALVAGLVAWQGRLLFPALPAIALLLAIGLERVRVGRRGVAWGVGGGLLVLALSLPFAVIIPAYPWHTLPAATAQTRIERLTYARYAQAWERGIELHGWRMSQAGEPIAPGQPVRAGQPVHITLTWHALERVPQDWTVFLHLVDTEGAIVAEHNSRPQLGRFPMPLWTPGDWLEDTHPLLLPADLPPGTYTLRVGLYRPWQRDPRRGERQMVWAADGSPLGDLADVGTLNVAAPK